MRVEIVEEAEGEKPAPPSRTAEDSLDLRSNPQQIESIAAARQFPPLRNFLIAVNGRDSIFATAGATTKSDSPAVVSAGAAYEFAFETELLFAEAPLNFERKRFVELSSGLKELLQRDKTETVRVALRISSRDFPAQGRRGFCLGIRLVAQGDSAQQAELRCGLALARLQQALLFRARSLKPQTGV